MKLICSKYKLMLIVTGPTAGTAWSNDPFWGTYNGCFVDRISQKPDYKLYFF